MALYDPYCVSRFTTVRRKSRPVMIGPVGVGGDYPIAVQSMTTTPTMDVTATVKQCIALAEAGCDIIRITAQNVKAAQALEAIRHDFSAAGFTETPLVADIHFLPSAAMEAVKWVEKVRINPGNYADKKKFAQREYSDSQYDEELERLHEAFSPIVLECKRLGRAMRIGTNHGSLSDRIMNRYGDTPLGMVESALEFLRIAESHGFRDIVLSMKASNPKVMIQAYRLMVAKMAKEDMFYPLHLGVTEAGDGNDARIKSSIGIGSLLADGLGDTIRVSLTEDPVYEVPVAQQLADKAMTLWRDEASRIEPDPLDPYHFQRRTIGNRPLGGKLSTGVLEPPLVIARGPLEAEGLAALQRSLKDAKLEGLLWPLPTEGAIDWKSLPAQRASLALHVPCVAWEIPAAKRAEVLENLEAFPAKDLLVLLVGIDDREWLQAFLDRTAQRDLFLALDLAPETLAAHASILAEATTEHVIVTNSSGGRGDTHALGTHRKLAEVLKVLPLNAPLWIRNTRAQAIAPQDYFGDQLIEASILSGALLCDGLGDLISVETVESPRQAVGLAYDILQGARARTTKTEFVACPSCGRTLFDLQSTTQRIREATGHLNGVTIAVMGCIVNGPGEMADADFGYVGGAPGKVNLYVGKECVRYHIPAPEAVDSLIDLIKEHGKWVEPKAEVSAT
jgi:(E)-4-hydroxy-3-methylbut-2-enyl-diphosphate synthase